MTVIYKDVKTLTEIQSVTGQQTKALVMYDTSTGEASGLDVEVLINMDASIAEKADTTQVEALDDEKVDKTQSVIAGAGMTGGGALAGDVTLNVITADDSLVVGADNVKVNTVDALTSDSATRPLSAKQGKALDVAKTDKTTQVIAGNGLTGGGTLASDRTINVAATDDSVVVAADGIKVDTVDTLVSTSATKPLSANQGRALNVTKVDKTDVEQVRSQATNKVASSKLLDDELTVLENADDAIVTSLFKTINIGTGGLVTMKPTTSNFTYRLNVLSNVTLSIDLTRMIQQVGNARCRLIIDMPIARAITITNPLLWGGTAPTFASAGQYVFEIIDVDGSGTPLIWQVASTTKAELTGNILFVDSTGADYSAAQINSGTPTRTTSSWATPFKYLQNAINAASAGDVIFVKAGVYKPTHLRTTPTVYVDGDRLNRNATFTPKNGVDIYGGFVGTETKTWQRVMDANGYPVAKTILCGDILGEATVDPAKTVGDTRTDASKANAAYNVVFAKSISALTYLNGVNIRYGNASEASGNQSSGGAINSASLYVGINNIAYSNTATNGGGWYAGTNTNCTAYSNTAATGGGWIYGTNTNCTAYSNTATVGGGGWYAGTNTNCTAYSNTATVNGGGWYEGTNTNCTAYSNTAAASGGGWCLGTNTNCTAYSNTAAAGGGWIYGTNTNCTGINNKAPQAVFGSTTTDTNINCLLYNNKTAAGVAVGFDNKTATGVKIFRNNAYDVAHPTITGGAGSDINISTCIQNLTPEQAKIEVPTVIGVATTPEQLAELHAYAAAITTKLKPKVGSLLKGAGVNNSTYPNPTDAEGTPRPEASTIGILEGE